MTWPSSILILSGAFVIVVAWLRVRRLTGDLHDATVQRPWRWLSFLLVAFVVGYLGSMVLILAGHWQWLASLSAVIFLAGAVYVLISVTVAERMAEALLDDSRRLEALVAERTAEAEVARRQAEEASRAKSHYLAEMSHELRTPLNSVVGFANILSKNRQQHLDEKELLYLERILDNGKHLLGLVNDILDLSKIEAGHIETQIETVNLERLLGEVLGQFSAQVRAKNDVRLLLEIPERPAEIETDRSKLFQVMVNLVGNALKFTEEGDVRVRVWVEAASRRPARIEVVDSGIGIAAEKLETIFEPFQQADASVQRRFGGTGLGLNISRSLCHLLGWRLVVSSPGPNMGSTFGIELLADPAEPLEEPRRDGDSSEVMPLTDLQLERTMRQDLEGRSALVIARGGGLVQEVQHFGITAFTAEDLDDAIDSFDRLDPELVIVDAMAGETGRRFLEHLRTEQTEGEAPNLLVIGSSLELSESWVTLEPPVTTLRLLGHLWKLVVSQEEAPAPQ